MEDGNIIASDCIVISCCCQCMILQILILLLLKLPCKLLKKTREYAKKLRARRRGNKIVQIEITGYEAEDGRSCRSIGSSFRIDIKDLSIDGFGVCMGEIDSVLEGFSNRGEFAFGSFWGGEVSSSMSLRSCVEEEEIDYDYVGFRLLQLFGAANFSPLVLQNC